MSEPDEPPRDTPPVDPFGLAPGRRKAEDRQAADPAPADPAPADPAAAEDLQGTDATDVLDPDAAIVDRGGYRGLVPLEPVIDTRRYQRIVLGFGLTLVVAISIFLAVRGGGSGGSYGIPAGQHLLKFVAPLARSDLNNPAANAHPVCNPARPSRRGLNVCNRKPIVLAFFATGQKGCIQQVDTLQTVSARFPKVTFAAVAVNADRAATRALVRSHHWTIPVAYDPTGVLAQVYGVEVCPIVEVAKANGVVAQRLIGKYWLSAQHLTTAVDQLNR